jgi:wyosine [tRNA(Phe)-imidazoG37] synthetase (radical SAM superfamily)
VIGYIIGMNKFVFGPVPSRRLGFSLGVDIITPKHCTFDCIYCQIGKTTCQEVTRRRFFDPDAIVEQVIEGARKAKQIDIITFSGSGEPTLNKDLGLMIHRIKNQINLPVAVITNGSLLSEAEVRTDLLDADIILPSLDAASDDIFKRINRPHDDIELDLIIQGLKQFRDEYRGQIWLEIMLIKDINDDRKELIKLKETVGSLAVDKIQLNTVVRPPLEEQTGKLSRYELEFAASVLGGRCEVICAFEKTNTRIENEDYWTDLVLETIKRRSLSLDDIVKVTGVSLHEVKFYLRKLEDAGQIRSYRFSDDIFYRVNLTSG